jgi:hypothetical protein
LHSNWKKNKKFTENEEFLVGKNVGSKAVSFRGFVTAWGITSFSEKAYQNNNMQALLF